MIVVTDSTESSGEEMPEANDCPGSTTTNDQTTQNRLRVTVSGGMRNSTVPLIRSVRSETAEDNPMQGSEVNSGPGSTTSNDQTTQNRLRVTVAGATANSTVPLTRLVRSETGEDHSMQLAAGPKGE